MPRELPCSAAAEDNEEKQVHVLLVAAETSVIVARSVRYSSCLGLHSSCQGRRAALSKWHEELKVSLFIVWFRFRFLLHFIPFIWIYYPWSNWNCLAASASILRRVWSVFQYSGNLFKNALFITGYQRLWYWPAAGSWRICVRLSREGAFNWMWSSDKDHREAVAIRKRRWCNCSISKNRRGD